MSFLHSGNIFVHVTAGLLAIVLGTFALTTGKGGPAHRKFGRWFLMTLTVVVGTGLIGAVFFRASPFLLILTLLAGYVGYAGFRVVRFRERRLPVQDMLVAAGVLATGLGSQLLNPNVSWNSSVITSTLSALVLVTVYDLLKYFWFFGRWKKLWLYEHIYKMTSAFSALLSAFGGNVLRDYQPYSQLLPSVLGVGIFVWFWWRAGRGKQTG